MPKTASGERGLGNMPMCETVKELQDRLTEIAKEVFS